MDAVDPDEDEWVNPIFAAAHATWPQTPENATLRADLTAAREEIKRLLDIIRDYNPDDALFDHEKTRSALAEGGTDAG
jgi:hypothetical protein